MNARGHLSSDTIDLMLMGGLQAPATEEAQRHLASCRSCHQRWSELTEDKAKFEQFVFPRTVERVQHRLARPPLAARLLGGWRVLLPATAAAAVALAVMVTRPGLEVTEPYLGTKGPAVAFEVIASRPGAGQFVVKPGGVLHPKDQLRFTVSAAGAKYVLVASRDGAGSFNVYYPFGAAKSGPVPTAGRELPGGVELDEVLGPERVVAAFSDEPLDAQQLALALAASPEPPRVPGARVLTIDFTKRPPP